MLDRKVSRFRYMSHRHVLFGQETNNAVKHMAQFIWCPRSQIQPRNFTGPWVFFTKLAVKNFYREPEPYDLWYLSSTWDQTQDPQFENFFLSFFSFFEIFCAIFFSFFFISVVGKESAPQTFLCVSFNVRPNTGSAVSKISFSFVFFSRFSVRYFFFLFFSYHCWEGERTTDFFCLFLFGLYYLVQAWGDVVKGVYVFVYFFGGGREI